MAVYTEVSDEALADFVTQYDIGQVKSCKGIAEGVENSNYLLHTDSADGAYILTLYEKRVSPDDLPFFLGLMEHLAGRGISCPTPIHGRDGRALRQLSGRPAAIVTYLDGMWVKRPQPDHCRQLGRAMAELHLAGADFPLRRPNALTVGDWRPLFGKCAAQADSVCAGLGEEISRMLDELETSWPANLPQGVVHADLFPDNVFFLNNKLSGLIDFYFACNDALIYDVAICLNAWCFEPDLSFNVTKARFMLDGYHSVRPISSEEIAALPLLARGAALRFLLTRLHDWLFQVEGAFVKPKDPMEYVAKLRFHRDVNNAAAYGFD